VILHLVTDRRRIGGATDRRFEQGRRLLALVARAIDAGVDAVQLRERDLDGGELVALASAMVTRAVGSRTRIIVNDRVDVAVAAGAHGVHLRSDSVPPDVVRSMAPSGFIIGRSVHSVEEARQWRDGVDYLLAGTVWASPSKAPGSPLLGIEGLRSVIQATGVPVLAIGGITLDRIPELARAGASGCAAIGLFAADTDDGVGIDGSLSALVADARGGFERAQSS
jgi:thiamine-phosphate diphosphorylase